MPSFEDSTQEAQETPEQKQETFKRVLQAMCDNPDLYKKLFDGKEIASGKLTDIVSWGLQSESPSLHDYLAEVKLADDKIIFVLNTRDTRNPWERSMSSLTGASMGREVWVYEFDGDTSTVCTDQQTGKVVKMGGEIGKDMDGLRQYLEGKYAKLLEQNPEVHITTL